MFGRTIFSSSTDHHANFCRNTLKDECIGKSKNILDMVPSTLQAEPNVTFKVADHPRVYTHA